RVAVADRSGPAAAARERLAPPGGGAAAATAPRRPAGRDRATVAGRRAEGARGGGFEPQTVAGGLAWVRRVSIDLRPFLERAGAPAPVTAAQLVRLALGDQGPHTPRWDASSAAVLDLET